MHICRIYLGMSFGAVPLGGYSRYWSVDGDRTFGMFCSRNACSESVMDASEIALMFSRASTADVNGVKAASFTIFPNLSRSLFSPREMWRVSEGRDTA